MALTIDEVKKIATLARLRLSPDEEVLFTGQLGKIVDYIDQLERYLPVAPEGAALAGAGAAPDAPDAPDVPAATLPREAFLANAPAWRDGFLLVPEVRPENEADGG